MPKALSEQAANRFVKWLEWKIDLFGEELHGESHMGLDQLDAGARFMVETGIMQIFPERDCCGRLVQAVAINYHRHWSRSSKALLQTFFCISMIAAEDEPIKKNGVVHIIYGLGKEQPHADHGEIDEMYDALGCSSITMCVHIR